MTGFVQKTLPQLIQDLPIQTVASSELPDVRVTGITEDSRAVETGMVFVAVNGMTVNGHQYIPKAISSGAAAIVGSDPVHDLPVPYIQVSDSRLALAHLSASFYNHPSHEMTLVGVTGTDGKTTTSNLIYQILLAARLPAGIISTVNAIIGDEVVDTGFHVTTPTAPEIQRYLARMKASGLTHAILEATSHGLSQHRVTGCEFDIGVLTNITHEHINEHGSFEAYRDAKARLFTSLGDHSAKSNELEPLAVLNGDDPSHAYLSERVLARKVTYSLQSGSDVWSEEIHHDTHGLHFVVNGPGFRIPIDCCLVGLFNVSNILAAVSAAVVGMKVDPDAARQGIANSHGVPGRMEQINMGQPFIALVDFAHTPNALQEALKTVRQMTTGKVIVVFGSAGLRDREKRRLMAEVSAEWADMSIFTAEDPRTESLDDILAGMALGAQSKGAVEGKRFLRVPDRGDAIRQAVRMAQPGDLVIACGKGHEQSMCFGTKEYPWDDRTAMRAALAERMAATGPQMPYLPTQEKE